MTPEFYAIWFEDGSGRILFRPSELDEYAARYDFNADDVRRAGEADLIDHVCGGIVGGVVEH
jgi:hypothetical protein